MLKIMGTEESKEADTESNEEDEESEEETTDNIPKCYALMLEFLHVAETLAKGFLDGLEPARIRRDCLALRGRYIGKPLKERVGKYGAIDSENWEQASKTDVDAGLAVLCNVLLVLQSLGFLFGTSTVSKHKSN